MKKNIVFTLIFFALMKWDDCLSVQLPFELPFQIPVQLFLELEANVDEKTHRIHFVVESLFILDPIC